MATSTAQGKRRHKRLKKACISEGDPAGRAIRWRVLCSKQEEGAYVWREGTQISEIAQNPPADTLAPLYESNSSSSVGYVMWNDEPGASHCSHGCTSFILAHSKGKPGLLVAEIHTAKDSDSGLTTKHKKYLARFEGSQVREFILGGP